MKTKIIIITLFCALLLSAMPRPRASVEFASAVETYIAVEFMVAKHVTPDMLAYKILHALTVLDYSIEEIYDYIYQETGGDVPEILEEYYADN